jgi:RNA polymerase sigma-70 factor (ECF subfamily)
VESDEALLQRVRDGEIEAFDRLYERHEGRLFAYLRAVVGDRSDAEEVLHDAFLSALKDRNAVLDREGSFRAWLYRVARNMALNKRRGNVRHEKKIALALVAETEPPPHADAELEKHQLEAALQVAVTKLPPNLGELWHLRTSGLSYEQIANVVDAPLGTIKSRVHQLVVVLREELKPWIAPQ